MYTILAKLDKVAEMMGVLRKEARVGKGVNPWGYTNGVVCSSLEEVGELKKKVGVEMLEKEGRGSGESVGTEMGLVGKV
jgi:hypothetical protein